MRLAIGLAVLASVALAAPALAEQKARVLSTGSDEEGTGAVVVEITPGAPAPGEPVPMPPGDSLLFIAGPGDPSRPIGMVGGVPVPGQPFGPPRLVRATYLGVATSAATDTLARQLGVPAGTGLVIGFVDEDSPAAKAGLLQHDVLLKLDDQVLVNPPQLAVLVRSHKAGDKVTLTLLREAKPQQVEAELVEKEMRIPAEGADGWVGGAARWSPFGGGPAGLWVSPAPTPRDPRALASLLAAVHAGAGGENAATASSMTMSDGEHTLNVTVSEEGKRLVAKDREGNVLFEGPVNTEAERAAVPPAILAKLERMERASAGRMPPAGQALGNVRAGGAKAQGAAEVRINDGEHDLRMSVSGGRRRLTARDPDGQVLFDGPIDTPEQLQAVPEPVRRKLQGLSVSVVVGGEDGPVTVQMTPPAPQP